MAFLGVEIQQHLDNLYAQSVPYTGSHVSPKKKYFRPSGLSQSSAIEYEQI